MTLTRDFKETLKARMARDQAFRSNLLSESVSLLLEGDVATGKAVLRDYINATIGFETLAAAVGTPPKSLMRMFSVNGNPRSDNLFRIIKALQTLTGVQLNVSAAA
jgi:DNA-binding phage protein